MQEIIPGKVSRCFAPSAVIAVLIFTSYWSLRLASADGMSRSNSLDALARAVHLDPLNARYREELAEYQEAAGLDSGAALAEACQLDPMKSSLWIRRGLHAESEGDYVHAEAFLLEAARVDKLFDPRATLSNYYFRRNNPEQFWRWTRDALSIGYGDFTSLFRLCWRMTDDPEVIRARALPPAPRVVRAYLTFLLAQNHLDAAAPMASRLASHAGAEDLPAVLAFTDRALAGPKPPRAAAALAAWNSLCIRNVLPFPPLAPERSLTNGDFRLPVTAQGFDWRVPETPGVSAVRLSPGGLRIDLSGKQPEQCELLIQFVSLTPGKTCRLRYSFRTRGLPAESGLEWRLFDLADARDLLPPGPPLSSDEEKPVEVSFVAQNASFARLVLGYSRVPGASRPEGSVTLHGLELGCAP